MDGGDAELRQGRRGQGGGQGERKGKEEGRGGRCLPGEAGEDPQGVRPFVLFQGDAPGAHPGRASRHQVPAHGPHRGAGGGVRLGPHQRENGLLFGPHDEVLPRRRPGLSGEQRPEDVPKVHRGQVQGETRGVPPRQVPQGPVLLPGVHAGGLAEHRSEAHGRRGELCQLHQRALQPHPQAVLGRGPLHQVLVEGDGLQDPGNAVLVLLRGCADPQVHQSSVVPDARPGIRLVG
mmetsp:Transcript_4548/g.13488  ORF Transcript_4548/g.13488 Transcript_4548/m.13488 type:complete len:234 (-) Transcript_4548:1290-1991(-)